MPKRTKPSAKASASPPPQRASVAALALLSAASVLTGVSVLELRALWLSLPGVRLARLDWQAVRQARAAMGGEAREGLILAAISNQVSDAVRHPERATALLADARASAAGLRRTEVGRLQLAALTMLRLEHERVPSEEWWPKLQGYLGGLDGAAFRHFMPELLDAEADIYARLGLPAGSARQLALRSVGHAHGPFLQYFVAQMRRIAEERRRADDENSAARCERTAHRLLREWLLTSGPAGLRLLAADLLAASLPTPDTGPAAPPGMTIATKCRAWRAAYRRNAATLPQPPPLVRIGAEPAPAVDARHLGHWLVLTGWTTAAMAAVGLLALLTAAFSIRIDVASRPTLRRHVLAAPAGVLIVAIGWATIRGAPDFARDDLLRSEVHDLGLPRLPFVAALAGLLVTGLTSTILVRQRNSILHWLSGIAAAAAGTWLVLGALLLPIVLTANMWRGNHERAMAYPLDEQLAAIADPNADGLLAELRAWHP